jgi:hypothetical protein
LARVEIVEQLIAGADFHAATVANP